VASESNKDAVRWHIAMQEKHHVGLWFENLLGWFPMNAPKYLAQPDWDV
jgi:hypothetical protein